MRAMRLAMFGPSLALLLLATSVSAQPQQRPMRIEHLVLRVGDQETISAAGVASYAVSGTVADVRVTADGATFVIVGSRPGETVLLLIGTDGSERRVEIQVVDLPTVSK